MRSAKGIPENLSGKAHLRVVFAGMIIVIVCGYCAHAWITEVPSRWRVDVEPDRLAS